MTFRGKVLAVVALSGLLIAPQVGLAQPAPQAAAPATRPASSILDAAPADAWAVIGANDLGKLDTQVMSLGQKLGLPIFFAPSGLVQMGLGITQGFAPSKGIAVIVLNPTKYAGAANLGMFANVPMPVVLALGTNNAEALVESLGGRQTETPGVWSVMLQQEPAYAALKSGYLLLSGSTDIVAALAASGAAATQPVAQALKPGMIDYVKGSDIFIYVNTKAAMATYGPVLKGLLAFAAAAAQGAQGQAGTDTAGPNMAMAGAAYVDVVTEQVDQLLVWLDLDATGLDLSALVTFQPDTVLQKAFAAAKPSGKPLLAALPGGSYVIVGGQERTGKQYTREVTDLFTRPYLQAMKTSGEPAMVAAAKHQEKVQDLQIQINELQQSGHFGLYQLPKADEAAVGAVLVGQFTDAAKAYDLIKTLVKSQVDFAAEQDPKAKEFSEAATYTEGVETVDGAKVNTLLVDLSQLPKVAQMPEQQAQQLVEVLKALLGTEALKARIVVREKDIVVTVGGGEPFLKNALAAAKATKAPLTTQPALDKVMSHLPKDRIVAFYLSAENGLQVADVIAKAMGQPGVPVQPGQTSAPLAAAMVYDPLGMHVTLYVPIDLMVNIKGMVNQGMMQQQQSPRPGQPGQPAPMPQPEF